MEIVSNCAKIKPGIKESKICSAGILTLTNAMKKSFTILQFSHDNPHTPASLILTSSPIIPPSHPVISSPLPVRSTARDLKKFAGLLVSPSCLSPALVPPSGVCSPKCPSRQRRAGAAETACAEHLFGSLPRGTSLPAADGNHLQERGGRESCDLLGLHY